MIKTLDPSDHEQLMNFLKDNSSINLFIIGDIERYGYDKDFQTVWAEFKENRIIAVLLKYHDFFIFSAKNPQYDLNQFIEIIEHYDFSTISGESIILKPFEKHYSQFKTKAMHFAEFTQFNEPMTLTQTIHKASIDDLDELIDLKRTIKEFEIIKDKSMIKKNIKEGMTSIYYIKSDGKIVSSAETTAENSDAAMIIGVCTAENYRNQGYASQLMIYICKKFIEKNKKLCLFYDNPDAGKIYRRLGFEAIGQWTMLQNNKPAK